MLVISHRFPARLTRGNVDLLLTPNNNMNGWWDREGRFCD